ILLLPSSILLFPSLILLMPSLFLFIPFACIFFPIPAQFLQQPVKTALRLLFVCILVSRESKHPIPKVGMALENPSELATNQLDDLFVFPLFASAAVRR
ncbi:hypothetical protein, partial [Desulfosoma sp.]|uniref:hypothetical protein n=1 Tax=Desulfosoma sp. TaxID=2603217 RepID=UPI00404943AF